MCHGIREQENNESSANNLQVVLKSRSLVPESSWRK